jgi:hypothetical protein
MPSASCIAGYPTGRQLDLAALGQHRHGGKIEAVEGFAGSQAGLDQMSLDASLIALGEFRFCQD